MANKGLELIEARWLLMFLRSNWKWSSIPPVWSMQLYDLLTGAASPK